MGLAQPAFDIYLDEKLLRFTASERVKEYTFEDRQVDQRRFA